MTKSALGKTDFMFLAKSFETSANLRPTRGSLLKHRSIDDDEAAVQFGKRRRHAPHRDAVGPPLFWRGVAFFVVKLPGYRPAFGPAGAFRPGEERVSICVGYCHRMFAFGGTRRGNRFRD